MTVLKEYYSSLPSWKVAKENGLILGVNIVVWGLWWGSQMASTWPHATGDVSRVKTRKRVLPLEAIIYKKGERITIRSYNILLPNIPRPPPIGLFFRLLNK